MRTYKASEIVHVLQGLIVEHGDLVCIDEYDHPLDEPEEVEGWFVFGFDKTRTVE